MSHVGHRALPSEIRGEEHGSPVNAVGQVRSPNDAGLRRRRALHEGVGEVQRAVGGREKWAHINKSLGTGSHAGPCKCILDKQ